MPAEVCIDIALVHIYQVYMLDGWDPFDTVLAQQFLTAKIGSI